MDYRFVQNVFRRYVRSPRLYAYARRALLCGQYIARRSDEVDYYALRPLNSRKNGLIVDVGANGGQSAVAFAFILPTFRILSFEPNPALWPELAFIRRIIGERFSYRPMGLGAEDGRMTLYVPYIGRLPVTTRASLSHGAAIEKGRGLKSDVKQEVAIREVSVDIARFDSLDLHPDAIKIDVEGCELDVLKGMQTILEMDRPVLIIESNNNEEECFDFVKQFGYEKLYYDPKAKTLTQNGTRVTRNWFAIPREQSIEFCG